MPKSIKSNRKPNYEVFAALDNEQEGGSSVEIARRYAKAKAGIDASSYQVRRNTGYQNELSNKFWNFRNGFSADGSGSNLPATEIIRLCQLAYWNNGTVGNVIDIMQEFTISNIDFLSSKKASRDAMLGWSAAIKLKGFCDQVALEYYRSGNVYIYRFNGKIKPDNFDRAGVKIDTSAEIPLRYTLINPAQVLVGKAGLTGNVQYSVVIPANEVELILEGLKKNAQQLVDMPSEFQRAFEELLTKKKSRQTKDIPIILNPDNVIALYRKKQPYELYALPFLARVLDDIDFKSELRAMDRALARVIARLLIHVKVGQDDLIPSAESLNNLRDLLANPSTSTYLVTDHTVSIAQYFPDVAAMLDPKKYTAINSDIQQALGVVSAAFGDGSGGYSNNFLGIKVLVERIKDGRSKILEDFIIPESEQVAKAFKIKSDVTPDIGGVDLNDEKEWAKIYTRLYEVGVFSPQSTIEGIRDGRVPTYQEEVDRQKEAKDLKDAGLFVTNMDRGGDSPDAGRPSGTKNPPQSKPKNVSPVGGSEEEEDSKVTLLVEEISKMVKNRGDAQRISAKQRAVLVEMAKDYLVQSNSNNELTLEGYLKSFWG